MAAGPWHDSQSTASVRMSVRHRRAALSKATVMPLPWHDWQLLNRLSSPRTRDGGQSPQSASRMAGVMGCHPRSVRVPVWQNQTRLLRLQSNGRNRRVPSGHAVTKPWVPPPFMWPPPITPSTEKVVSASPSRWTRKLNRPATCRGMTTASRNRMGSPLKGAMTRTSLVGLPGTPPAVPCVERFHVAYSAAWHDWQLSAPAKSAGVGGVGGGVSAATVSAVVPALFEAPPVSLPEQAVSPAVIPASSAAVIVVRIAGRIAAQIMVRHPATTRGRRTGRACECAPRAPGSGSARASRRRPACGRCGS